MNSPIPSPHKDLFEFGPFRLDCLRHTLQKEGKSFPLPPKAFDLLVLLVQRSGELLTKADLLNAVWPDTFVEENNLTQYVSMLRKLLGEGGTEDQKYIETVPRLGYRFVAKVHTLAPIGESLLWTKQKRTKVVIREEEEEEFDDSTDKSLVSIPAIDVAQPSHETIRFTEIAETPSIPSRSLARWEWTLVPVMCLAVIAAGLFATRARRPRSTPAAAAPLAALIKPRHSVALLGIRNLSRNADDEWLTVALTEMLSTELAAGGQLRVVPGEETSRVRSDLNLPDAAGFSSATLAQIRDRVGSDVVITGSLVDLNRNSGRRIRLDLRVQDSGSGETLASIAQTGTVESLFALVSRSGTDLREKLGVPVVSGAEESELQAALPSTPEAVRLYSEGLLRLRSYDALAAHKLLSKAVSLEPSFALGHAALARAWSALGYDERAKLAAKRAFDLSENLSRQDRLSIAAQYRETLRDWDKAVATYQALYGLFPDNLEYGLRLADAQTSGGKAKDALVTIEQLRKLPRLVSRDPRIDLAEAAACEALGDFEQDRMLTQRAGKNAELIGERMVEARAAVREGWALRRLGQGEEATTALQKAQKVFSASGDEQGVATALRASGAVFAEKGDYARAQKDAEEALAIFRRIGDRRGTALSLNSLAIIQYERGELSAAKALYVKSLEIQREVGSKTNTAGALGNIANVADAQGDLAEALKLNEESLTIFRETGDQRATGTALGNVAILLFEMGDLKGAKAKYTESLAIKQKIGYQRGIAFDLSGLGEVFRAEGDLATARKKQEESLGIRNRLGEKHNTAASTLYLAQLSLEDGRPGDAESGARQAEEEFRTEKSESDEAMALVVLAQSLLVQQKVVEARAAIGQAEKFSRRATNLPLQFEVLLASTRIAMAGKDAAFKLRAEDSRGKLDSALHRATKCGYLEYQLKIRLLQAEIEILVGNSAKGRAQIASVQQDAKGHGFGLLAQRASTSMPKDPGPHRPAEQPRASADQRAFKGELLPCLAFTFLPNKRGRVRLAVKLPKRFPEHAAPSVG